MMTDDPSPNAPRSGRATSPRASVTDLSKRRRRNDVLHSITVVFGGVHYGTIVVDAPYLEGKPMTLYVVPAQDGAGSERLSGPIDCLITDDASLVQRRRMAT
jgi:hypothetical protein